VIRKSKTRSSEASSEELASLFVSMLAGLLVVTCAAGERSRSPGAAPPAPAPSAAPSAAGEAPSSAPLASAPNTLSDAGADSAPALSPPSVRLSRFFHALGPLARHEPGARVRVLWFGDSHTAADYLTHAVRRPLQERFGNGGPGFVQLGVERTRHALVKTTREGKWRREPASPALGQKQLDGVFGLGGQRVIPESADARVGLELLEGAVAGDSKATFVFRADADDRFRVSVRGTGKSESLKPKSGRAVGVLRHQDVAVGARGALDVGVTGGAPELFGALVESDAGGFVLDTLGINGARAQTVLAWNEAEWQAAVRERAPALFVFAYGTNEAASTFPTEKYEKSLSELVARAHAAQGSADCLLVGPPDMATLDGKSQSRALEHDAAARRVAERSGCHYFSALSAMGGEGSFGRWMKEKPPLAAPDRVHLAPSGYEKIGSALARELLEAFDAKR